MSDDSNDGFEDNGAEEVVAGEGLSDSNALEASEDFNMSVKEKERIALQNQIEEFLARGGTIDEIDANITADPPQKPSSNYGSRPI
jgi:DNA phosphorothioation-dependent restriction protein DptG